jgi:hypothetical protein
MNDLLIEGTEDKRGIPLQELMDLMASVHVIVGQSSGVMHLATLCGLRQVVWAEDNKTYFNEKLEKRYKETWNPLGTPVSWVQSDNWCPEPGDVIRAVISGGADNRPTDSVLSKLKAAVDSGRYMVALVYIQEKNGKETAESFIETVNFPNNKLTGAINQIKSNMDELLKNEDVELRQEVGIWR